MKKIKKSVQNNALVLLKEREMFFNAFRSCMFKMPWKKSKKKNQMTYFQENFIKENQHKNQNQNLHYQHQNLSREFYQKTFTRKLTSRKRNQKISLKTNATEIAINIHTTKAGTISSKQD